MSLSASEVWERLKREGLVVGAQGQRWAQQVAAGLDQSQASQGLRVLQRLIELQKLTPYQAKIVAGQSTGPLRLGNWCVLQPVTDPVWPGWLLVRPATQAQASQASLPPTQAARWAFPVDGKRLKRLQAAAPSLPRAVRLAASEHPAIQKTMLPEQSDDQLLLLVAPISGPLLSEKFAGPPCDASQAAKIIRHVASGLAALHRQGIAHGRVLPDRIYLQQDQPVLAMDPLCAACCRVASQPEADKIIDNRSAAEESSGLLAGLLGATETLRWLAPEYQLAGQVPTASTDVYSLGCLWWWLLTGEPPVAGNSASEIWQQHSAPSPALPAACELPTGQWRCLQHALARNPSARFASAEALLRAMDAVDVAPAQASRSQAMEAVPIAQPRRVPEDALPLPIAPDPAPASPLPTTATARPQSPSSLEPSSLAPSPILLRRRRQRRPAWFVPVLAGCGVLVLLLVVLGLSGVLQPGDPPPARHVDAAAVGSTGNAASLADLPIRDPREAAYRIVPEDPQLLWVPPELPIPLPLDLLPPGGQLFISFRPADMLDDSGAARTLMASFDQELSPLLSQVRTWAGLPLEEIAHIAAAFYPASAPGAAPQFCLRVELLTARPLGDLKRVWQVAATADALTNEDIAGQTLLIGSQQRAYYVTPQPLLAAQSIHHFSVGPVELMRDAAELRGEAGPLVPQLERLWSSSDRGADLSLFAATPFLLTEGRSLFAGGPPRLTEYLKRLLTAELRGIGLQMRWEPTWYVEARFIGVDTLKTGKLLTAYEENLRSLPAVVESQLVSQPPAGYWRGLALRYPHMLRTLAEHTRFGVENGTAILNTYLPSEAASNVLLASWLAVHDMGGSASPLGPAQNAGSEGITSAGSSALPGSVPLGIDAYLDRPIRLSFDQEPIEVALSLVAAEANYHLPAGTPAWRFAVDGDAFEKAGITRNQQLRDFRLEDSTVRGALTEIAKRGNPVTDVSDMRSDDQRLLWVVAADPEQPGQVMILLTTRTAALAAGTPLPVEFRSGP